MWSRGSIGNRINKQMKKIHQPIIATFCGDNNIQSKYLSKNEKRLYVWYFYSFLRIDRILKFNTTLLSFPNVNTHVYSFFSLFPVVDTTRIEELWNQKINSNSKRSSNPKQSFPSANYHHKQRAILLTINPNSCSGKTIKVVVVTSLPLFQQ